MAEINTLPKISEATRERLRSYGFTNHLYDYLNLPTYFIPRAPGCTLKYTQSMPTLTSLWASVL